MSASQSQETGKISSSLCRKFDHLYLWARRKTHQPFSRLVSFLACSNSRIPKEKTVIRTQTEAAMRCQLLVLLGCRSGLLPLLRALQNRGITDWFVKLIAIGVNWWVFPQYV